MALSKRKIKFTDLVQEYYGISVSLQVLAWILKHSKGYTEQSGWYRYGFDKLIYGYSANDHKSLTQIKDREHVELMLYRAFFSTYASPKVLQFRQENGIERYDTAKFFSLDLENPLLSFGNKPLFYILDTLSGKELKKEFAHPDFPDRTKPVITSAKFTISASGYHVFYHFTFEETKGSGWNKEFWSDEKTLPEFLEQTFREIDKMLVEPFIF